MRGSRQITDDMKYKIIEYHFRNSYESMTPRGAEIINNIYDEIREYTIEVGGYEWNYHRVYDNEDEAILEKEHLNRCGCGQFRNFKVLNLYTIWERI